MGPWGKEADTDSGGGRDRNVGTAERSSFAIGRVSVIYPIPRFWRGYEGFYIRW